MKRRLVPAALMSLLCALPSHADTFTPLPGLSKSSLDLDTMDGNYSEWKLPDIAVINAARTTVWIAREGSGGRWAPSLSVAVGNSDEMVIFRISQHAPFQTTLEHFRKGVQPETLTYSTHPGLGDKVTIAVDWTPDGSVIVTAGGEQHQMKLTAPATWIDFSASTCDAHFDPLEIGHTSP